MQDYINITFRPGLLSDFDIGTVKEKAVILLDEANAVLKGE